MTLLIEQIYLVLAGSGSSPFSAYTKRTAHLLHLLFVVSYFLELAPAAARLSRLLVCLTPPLAAAYSGSSPLSAYTKRTAHLLHLLFIVSYFLELAPAAARLSRLLVCLTPPLAAAYSGSSPLSAYTKRTAHLKVSCSFGADEGT